jgi:LytS/YehU family sensor histidine kinase
VLRVEVANTGSVAKNSRGFGIGLENVRGRLEKLFPGRGDFKLFEENGWVRARIEIRAEKN